MTRFFVRERVSMCARLYEGSVRVKSAYLSAFKGPKSWRNTGSLPAYARFAYTTRPVVGSALYPCHLLHIHSRASWCGFFGR